MWRASLWSTIIPSTQEKSYEKELYSATSPGPGQAIGADQGLRQALGQGSLGEPQVNEKTCGTNTQRNLVALGIFFNYSG